ncbi:Redoxin domain protein [Paludibacter propionicigenes WB4]|uniref:Redoxin domain protein n=1 Tax=Paludibacter propionicigenes (strain DSM 17365 / JCM 13257 / WB4) TaxID=694427 RepID=E4T8B5_PALPW|nr:TlpA disulfide reductase family protein [Paludibacter propionicigenes]ADQ80959.1 Redoxin domain protein [Paludibacter propionicigenes WB4]
MRKIPTLVLFVLIVASITAQNSFEKTALSQAKEMANYSNSHDFKKYVDYLLPFNYGNNSNNKEKLSEMFKRSSESDTATIRVVKTVKSIINKDQYQILILCRERNRDHYIFGISNDKGKNWLFTQPQQTKMNFNALQEMIPTISTSFSPLVDPKFGKRINYIKGEKIAPFKFTDINGKILSSDSLKGKVIVLNFWSMSCGPCIKEIPDLNELVAKMKSKEVVFIAPAVYTSKDDIVKYLLPKHPFSYQIVCIENDDDYNVNSFPTHVIIDQNMNIVYKYDAYSKENTKKMEEILMGLLK